MENDLSSVEQVLQFTRELGWSQQKFEFEKNKVKRDGLLTKLQPTTSTDPFTFEIRGRGGDSYSVVIDRRHPPGTVSCSCPAARKAPLCKHGLAALLSRLPVHQRNAVLNDSLSQQPQPPPTLPTPVPPIALPTDYYDNPIIVSGGRKIPRMLTTRLDKSTTRSPRRSKAKPAGATNANTNTPTPTPPAHSKRTNIGAQSKRAKLNPSAGTTPQNEMNLKDKRQMTVVLEEAKGVSDTELVAACWKMIEEDEERKNTQGGGLGRERRRWREGQATIAEEVVVDLTMETEDQHHTTTAVGETTAPALPPPPAPAAADQQYSFLSLLDKF